MVKKKVSSWCLQEDFQNNFAQANNSSGCVI